MSRCPLFLYSMFGLLWLGVALVPSSAHASDVRLALLVGNQAGWKGDPRLKFALSGDLLPMKKALQRSGFSVFATLQNQNAATLRQTMQKLRLRLQRKPYVTTFFFYYSGHADKHTLHMGPRGSHPFQHKELVLKKWESSK